MKAVVSWCLAFAFAISLVGCGGGGGSSDSGQQKPPISNAAPTANAGPLQNVLKGATVTLDGSGSDANGDVLTYSWSLVSPSGSVASLSQATTPKPTFVVDVEGTYLATLVVNDGKVNSTAATVTITAAIANAAPVANAGMAQNVVAGTLVTLDGSASSDANGDQLTYSWSLTSQPSGSSAALAAATSAKPTFTADAAGNYVATLTVNDGKVNSTAATVTVTAAVANVAPVANAGVAQNVLTGTIVTLDGSASSDANGDQLTYSWSLTSKPVGSVAVLASVTSAKPTFTAALAGTYVVALTVNDGKVNSTAATVTVTAAVANVAPVANAGVAQNVLTGTIVTLDGSASSDANGDQLTYSWSLTSKPAGSTAALVSSTSAKPTFTADAAGTYVTALTVNDGKVNSTSTSVTVTAAVANVAPVANAGVAQSVVAGTLVTLDGSASSDANGDQLTYSWSLTSKPMGSAAVLTLATSVRPVFTADQAGTYVASLIVNDGKVNSTTTMVAVAASVANAAPVANAGVAQNVVAGTAVTLDGSASSDANGDQLTYNWRLTGKPAGSAAALTLPTSAKPTFTSDLAGTYVASLTVNDGKVNSNTATVSITASVLAVTDAGKVITKIGEVGYASAVLTQSDGKIVAVGAAGGTSDKDFAVVRYNKDGSLDTTFAGTGIVRTNIAGRIRSTEWVRGAAIQTDGKIVVAGYTSTYGDPAYAVALVRYNQDGSLDSSFGGAGIVTTSDSIKNYFINGIKIQSDGKIVVAGAADLYTRTTPDRGTLLIRYNTDGTIDRGFGRDGVIIDTSTLGASGVALQTDGKILIAGAKEYKGNSTSNVFALARYDSTGNLDTTFAGTGIVTTEIGTEIGSSDSATALALQADGRILVAGVTYSGASSNDFALVRYMSNGSLDSSFGVGGKLKTDFSRESDLAYALAVQPNGKILLAGSAMSLRSNPMPFPGFYSAANIDFAVVRYNSDGAIDTSFGVNGKIVTDFGLLGDDAYAISLQNDGSIVLSGGSQIYVGPDAYTSFATARYTSNGSLDPTFRNR